MKIAILGFAGQGQAAYEYWNKPGNEITICDLSVDISLPDGVTSQLGEDYLANLDRFDLLIRTPALHPKTIRQANRGTSNILDKVTTVTNEFFKACPSKNIIGVTGTKGKGTTSTLITRMLEATGHRVHLGGNIGIPPLDLLKDDIKSDDWVVLELANFQLIDLRYSPHIAVCLMITPEHLDWHEDIDEYVAAKQQLFSHQKENDIAVFYAESNYSEQIARNSAGLVVPYMRAPGAEVIGEKDIVIDGKVICSTSDVMLLGKHNWQNICAALTVVWNITQDVSSLGKAITGFQGLPHRLEPVRVFNEVEYFNDSFASAPDASIAAMNAISGSKVMIIGGFDRGLELNELARACLTQQEDLRRVIVIGEVSERLSEALRAHGFTNFDVLGKTSLQKIVQHAKRIAEKQDKIVFSPGFASFDMFKNFEDRGLQFKKIVSELEPISEPTFKAKASDL